MLQIGQDIEYYPRADWGADTSIPRLGNIVAREKRTHVIIHHTVMVDTDGTPNIWESENAVFENMQRLQTIRPDLGLDVPYNFVAYPKKYGELVICEGRGEDRSGAHTSGHNTAGLAVSFAGNFEDHNFNFAPYAPALSDFLAWLRYDANLPGYGGPYEPMSNLGAVHPDGRQVFAHQDFKATACPGKYILYDLDRVDFMST